ncbi:MAG: DUF4363 family protein [Clostridium perfringens]|nr:DUF4363 family protein [Clostridium perfringens]
MKNTIISFIIFFVVLGFVFIGNKNLNSLCNDSLRLSNEIEILINNNEWNKALEKSIELKKVMSQGFRKVSVYINHQDIDNLNTETVKLIDFIRIEELPDTLSCLDNIKCLSEYIKELQQINLTNIL